MSDRPEDREDQSADVDTGAPVSELAVLARPVGDGFLGGIRRAIQRRNLVAQAADLSWHALASVLLEYLKMIFASLQPKKPEGR